MTLVLVFALIKTMNLLRIFGLYSVLVTMIKQVVIDIAPFLTFFFIMIAMFALIMGVLGF